MKRTHLLGLVAGLIVLIATSSTSFCETLEISWPQDFTTFDIIVDGEERTVSAGSMYGSDPDSSFETYLYCVELGQTIDDTTYDFETSALATQELQEAGWLISEFGDEVNGTAESAALQVAIWEVTHESDDEFDLFSGSFQLDYDPPYDTETPFFSKLEEIRLAYEAEVDFDFDMDEFLLYSSDDAQDLIGYGPKPVPEPATMILFGTGLAGLAGVGARRKKK